ncbi:MAG: DUF2807 domain-containing protein [Bacteroidales bacterium]
MTIKNLLLLPTICLILCSTISAQEVYTKFYFSGYRVKLITSEVFDIKMSDANIQFTKEFKDGILSISVIDQTGRVPKDEIILYAKNIEYMYLHNCQLVMSEPIVADSMNFYCGSSHGELKIVANSLLVNVGGGSHVKLSGKTNIFNCEVGAGSSLEASELFAEEGNVDAIGYSMARINMKEVLHLKKENATVENVYKAK